MSTWHDADSLNHLMRVCTFAELQVGDRIFTSYCGSVLDHNEDVTDRTDPRGARLTVVDSGGAKLVGGLSIPDLYVGDEAVVTEVTTDAVTLVDDVPTGGLTCVMTRAEFDGCNFVRWHSSGHSLAPVPALA